MFPPHRSQSSTGSRVAHARRKPVIKSGPAFIESYKNLCLKRSLTPHAAIVRGCQKIVANGTLVGDKCQLQLSTEQIIREEDWIIVLDLISKSDYGLETIVIFNNHSIKPQRSLRGGW
jgi:hypothetical protein